MIPIERIPTDPAPLEADGNIRAHYPIECASWLWHPDLPADEPAVLRFENTFTLDEPVETVLHVSADQRFELCVDGTWLAIGPDRSDLDHWAFSSWKLSLAAGSHRLTARVWWIDDHRPSAQFSLRGGFIAAGEGPMHDRLTTGVGPWMVTQEAGWSFEPGLWSHFTGAACVMDGGRLFDESTPVEPAVVFPPLADSPHGVVRDGWRLHPSQLPDQLLEQRPFAAVRAVCDGAPLDGPAIAEDECVGAQVDAWQAFVVGGRPKEIGPRQSMSVLFDMGDYVCGYPSITLSGGAGSSVAVRWAEALYKVDDDGKRLRDKGNRSQVVGKTFYGTHDRLVHDGSPNRTYRPLWWRAGRYVLLTIQTADEALTVKDLHVVETRYPVECESSFRCSEAPLEAIQPMLVRGIQMCAHETYMDCPFWEQLMYVGDTRLEMLTTYVMTPDSRLPRRGIELFDWSSRRWSMVAERYPSHVQQLSPTFSLIWILMVQDYAWWRDDAASAADRLVTVRNVLEAFRRLATADGLLGRLPGWPFVDWVPGWKTGNAPGGIEGDSSINNLFFVAALRAAADMEDHFGEAVLARRNRALADDVSTRIVERWWRPEANLLADDSTGEHFSEHAQCLALLYDALPPESRQPCFSALLTDERLARATVYFSFYLLETLRLFGRGDLIRAKLDFWSDLLALGLKTPLEMPEPSRSDCHAWSSHPLFHLHATLAGIRPGSPGFATVNIAPLVREGTWQCRTPHPKGWIDVNLDLSSETGLAEVILPEGATGCFTWNEKKTPLRPGRRSIDLHPASQ